MNFIYFLGWQEEPQCAGLRLLLPLELAFDLRKRLWDFKLGGA